ncbi:alkaline phosphatase family protein [Gemmatimonas sp.]|uniref:alkaline phosphatase family protein n=1 Tax=Gemmatimonas sp. TaxID=1962908 RepID=UPI00333ECAE6
MRHRLGMQLRRAWCTTALLMGGSLAAPAQAHAPSEDNTPVAERRRLRVLLVVFDGLRPDHITPSRMPNLEALRAGGVMSWQHHSLFPTVTRVNASALATGTGPAGHGILDNSIFLPSVSRRVLNTGDARDMLLADSVLAGRLLTATTIGARLRAAGKRMMVASAGSSGSAYLFAGGDGTPVVNPELVLPAALAPAVTRLLGEAPPDASPNLGRNAWAVDALLRVGIDSLDVDVGYLWLSDPDHTAHGAGLGSTLADSSIRAADREFGRLLDGLRTRGLRDSVNVIVVSDHGFSTHEGNTNALRARLGGLADSVVIAGSAVHVLHGGTATRDSVVRTLQQWSEAGAILTASDGAGPGAVRGTVLGTLPMSAIAWQHARAADVLYSAQWSHAANSAGHKGSTRQSGVAGHGTSSPYDITATFVAAGPVFRTGVVAATPSSNADIVPTVLHLLGQPSTPAGVTGRPLLELLTRGKAAPAAIRDSLTAEVSGYRTVMYRTRVGGTLYFDSTRTVRR